MHQIIHDNFITRFIFLFFFRNSCKNAWLKFTKFTIQVFNIYLGRILIFSWLDHSLVVVFFVLQTSPVPSSCRCLQLLSWSCWWTGRMTWNTLLIWKFWNLHRKTRQDPTEAWSSLPWHSSDIPTLDLHTNNTYFNSKFHNSRMLPVEILPSEQPHLSPCLELPFACWSSWSASQAWSCLRSKLQLMSWRI